MPDEELLLTHRTEGENDQHLEVEDAELNPREQELNAGAVEMRGAGIQAPQGFQAPALTAGAGFQGGPRPGNISKIEERKVRERAKAQNGNIEYAPIKKGKRKNAKKDTAMVVKGGGSMAADPAFEERARKWEMRFGGFLNTEARTKAMAKKAGDFVLNYLETRFQETNKAVEAVLPKLGTKENTFSGAVGDELNKVRKAFTSGSVSVKMNHFQKFSERFLSGDIKKLSPTNLDNILRNTTEGNVPNPALTAGIAKVKKGGRLQSPSGIAAEQWHTRAERNPETGNEDHDKVKDQSKRTYGDFKAETGTDFSHAEKKHMGFAFDFGRKDDTQLPINEGGEKWILNERDKWVRAMREMSLPLLAGPSGTTARLFQAFQQFGINDQPTHSRLAVIAYIVPNRHHSLVEVMSGATQNGGPPFTPTHDFHRHIAPFTQPELRNAGGPFPDEG